MCGVRCAQVQFLPPQAPEGEEASNGQQFADAVRRRMGEASGYPLHHLGSRELRKEMKEQAERATLAKREGAKKKGNGASSSPTDPLL